MNRSLQILILATIAFFLASCHKDKDLENKDPKVSNIVVTPAANSASFSWTVEFAGQFQTGVELSEHENMTDLRRVEATKQDDKFVAVVENLKASTQYYFRIVVWNKFNNYEEETKDFTMPAQTYTVSVSCSPVEGGTVTGGGTFTDGETCKVTATANLNYSFVNWTENGNQVSTEPEYNFTVTSNRTLVANFTSQEYTITATADPENGGTISGCGGYNSGDECTLTATANEGYSFVNWTKGGTEVSTNSTFTFTVTETAVYVAHFQIQSYTISVNTNPENGGSVEGGGTYEYGQACTVKAIEANGYHFVNWTENGGQVSSNEEYSFTITSDRDLVANFSAEDYIISVEIEPEDSGTVTGAGGYNHGDECTLTATANEGYDFTKWTKNGTQVSTEQSISFTVTESASYKAHFTAKSYTISVSAEPSDGGNVTGGGDYHYGEECTLTATANEGYDFDHWTKDGSQISGGVTINFDVTANATYVAYFIAQSYTITIQSNPTNGGTVTGGGQYTYGQNCTLTATANTDYIFDYWTKDGSTISGGATINFTVTANATYVAYFICPEAPVGAINGLFTINENGDKVFFSQGNLQYIGSANTPYWKFADHQWDYLGSTTNQYSAGQNVDRDLFGWGTSGWDSGAVHYQPWSTGMNSAYYGIASNNLTGAYANADWGVYNPISNGGNQPGQWRTLTGGEDGEWKYIFDTRSASTVNGVPNARYAMAKVNNVQGMILFPDSYTHPDGIAQPIGINDSGDTGWNGNIYSVADFEMMAANGAVFLPAAGNRYTQSLYNLGSCGYYWSTSANDIYYAYSVHFYSGSLNPSFSDGRSEGLSVRLVAPAGN